MLFSKFSPQPHLSPVTPLWNGNIELHPTQSHPDKREDSDMGPSVFTAHGLFCTLQYLPVLGAERLGVFILVQHTTHLKCLQCLYQMHMQTNPLHLQVILVSHYFWNCMCHNIWMHQTPDRNKRWENLLPILYLCVCTFTFYSLSYPKILELETIM